MSSIQTPSPGGTPAPAVPQASAVPLPLPGSCKAGCLSLQTPKDPNDPHPTAPGCMPSPLHQGQVEGEDGLT